MKKWLKDNALILVGNIFIWVLPLILCLIMSFGGTKEPTPLSFKLSLWGIVVILAYLVVYYKKLKKLLERHKTIQITKLGYTKIWVRVIELIAYLLPYVCALFLIVGLKGVYERVYEDLVTFIVLTMISATIGYCILMVDTKNKAKVE